MTPTQVNTPEVVAAHQAAQAQAAQNAHRP